MRTYRTLDAIEEEYLTNHPEEIDDYLNEIFAEYAKDGNSTALFSSLRVIARVKGINRTPTHAAILADRRLTVTNKDAIW